MFVTNLSLKLYTIFQAEQISNKAAARMCGVSVRHLGAILRGKAAPSIAALEKICCALNTTPDALLLPQNAVCKEQPLRVRHVLRFASYMHPTEYPVCPRCSTSLEREYQSYCDRCGQRLDWRDLAHAEVIVK